MSGIFLKSKSNVAQTRLVAGNQPVSQADQAKLEAQNTAVALCKARFARINYLIEVLNGSEEKESSHGVNPALLLQALKEETTNLFQKTLNSGTIGHDEHPALLREAGKLETLAPTILKTCKQPQPQERLLEEENLFETLKQELKGQIEGEHPDSDLKFKTLAIVEKAHKLLNRSLGDPALKQELASTLKEITTLLRGGEEGINAEEETSGRMALGHPTQDRLSFQMSEEERTNAALSRTSDKEEFYEISLNDDETSQEANMATEDSSSEEGTLEEIPSIRPQPEVQPKPFSNSLLGETAKTLLEEVQAQLIEKQLAAQAYTSSLSEQSVYGSKLSSVEAGILYLTKNGTNKIEKNPHIFQFLQTRQKALAEKQGLNIIDDVESVLGKRPIKASLNPIKLIDAQKQKTALQDAVKQIAEGKGFPLKTPDFDEEMLVTALIRHVEKRIKEKGIKNDSPRASPQQLFRRMKNFALNTKSWEKITKTFSVPTSPTTRVEVESTIAPVGTYEPLIDSTRFLKAERAFRSEEMRFSIPDSQDEETDIESFFIKQGQDWIFNPDSTEQVTTFEERPKKPENVSLTYLGAGKFEYENKDKKTKTLTLPSGVTFTVGAMTYTVGEKEITYENKASLKPEFFEKSYKTEKGRNCHDSLNYKNATNLGVTELKKGGKTLFSALRSGVSSAYGIDPKNVHTLPQKDFEEMVKTLLLQGDPALGLTVNPAFQDQFIAHLTKNPGAMNAILLENQGLCDLFLQSFPINSEQTQTSAQKLDLLFRTAALREVTPMENDDTRYSFEEIEKKFTQILTKHLKNQDNIPAIATTLFNNSTKLIDKEVCAIMRRQAALNKEKEKLTAGLLSNKEKFLERLQSGAPIRYTSLSLLTPAAKFLNPKEFRAYKEQVQAMQDLEKEVRSGAFVVQLDDTVIPKDKISFSLCNFGVNTGAVGVFAQISESLSGWTRANRLNEKALKTMLGQSLHNVSEGGEIGGAAGEEIQRLEAKLSTLTTDPKKYQELLGEISKMKQEARMIAQIWINGDHKKDGNAAYKMVTLIAHLSYLTGDLLSFNCFSGKDRTGQLGAEVQCFAFQADQTPEKIPDPNRVKNELDKQQISAFVLESGNFEMQKYNTGLSGYKLFEVPSILKHFYHETLEKVFHGISKYAGT